MPNALPDDLSTTATPGDYDALQQQYTAVTGDYQLEPSCLLITKFVI